MDRKKRNERIKKLRAINRERSRKLDAIKQRQSKDLETLSKLENGLAAENWQLLLDGKLSELEAVDLLAIYKILKSHFDRPPEKS